MRVGSLVGSGRTAEVFEFGARSVVKLLRPGIPSGWAEQEASLTAAVHARGLPTPAVRGLVDLDGRPGVVFERIDGPSMWSEMLGSTEAADRLSRVLAEMHREIQAELAPPSLPSLIGRIAEKMDRAHSLSTAERAEARRTAISLDGAPGLCHGDMHPGNVIVAATGPVVIDWYDAAAGSPTADVVRTSLLIRPPSDEHRTPFHLPGASRALLCKIHARYLASVMADRPVPAELVRTWERVLAASRLGERAEPDETELVKLWRNRDGERSSVLLRELGALGVLTDHAAEDRDARR